jgi:hypothetical protein
VDLDPRELSSGELALRIATAGDARAYFFFLACAANAQGAVGELVEEIRATDLEVVVDSIAPSTGAGLLAALPEHVGKLLVIDATAYVASDWRTLDRRRSSLVHDKALVFVTTVGSFGILMQQAPHLASWLGGEVFAIRITQQNTPRSVSSALRRFATGPGSPTKT